MVYELRGAVSEIIKVASNARRKICWASVGLCETKLVVKHEEVMGFKQDMHKIIDALLETWRDFNTSGEAKSLLIILCDSEIIVSLCSLSHMLSYSFPLSKFFQKNSIDLHAAANIMKDILNILSECRENVSTQFTEIYKSSESMAKTQKVDLKITRNYSRQTNRTNYPTNITVEYYKLT
ncbi:Hypothetical protein CINCED_3A014567 [Cinara cedri]|uniref:Uncharacterized protein n=1 Tax=Cinara cedri TaxID=506608 RepID=A0A5E4N6L9_9HEMI|nr:Hypothetical protein CINCED_3A014567 [Cinara cedri]